MISNLDPKQHGGDAASIARSLGVPETSLLDLSASLNPFAPDVPALAANRLSSLVAYPDDGPATQRLAKAMGVDPDKLVLTNGGSEAIALLGVLLGVGEVVEPEFSLYRRHLNEVEPGAGRWRSNPSNPLGTLAKEDETAAVWDEAFYPIATGNWTRGDSGSWRIGSMTKLWSCAGLRLGYVIAPTIAQAGFVRDLRPRWSVNGLALALIDDLLDQTDLTKWASQIQDLGKEFAAQLAALGFDAHPTAANWILIHNTSDLRQNILSEGVVIRDCSNFSLPGTVRVALPRPAELDRVVSAFAEVAHSTDASDR